MCIVSHLHHLFNADTCQSYIHALRWKDRPLQCPRCQSHNVGAWGTYHYQPGLKRYRCKEKGCKRTFNDLTGTLLDGSKRSVMHWMLATFLLCLSCSSRRNARELGVHRRTSYRWCWWLRNAALSYEMGRQLEGTVEADDLSYRWPQGPSQAGWEKVIGTQATEAPQETRARAGPLRQGSARHHRVDQPPGRCRNPRDAGLYRQDGPEGSGPRRARGQSALYGLGQQLSGAQGLCARLCQSHPKGICPWGRA